MTSKALASRYAKVLFQMDQPRDRLTQRLQDFEKLVPLFQEEGKLMQFLKSPRVGVIPKKELLHSLFENQLDEHFLHFLDFLVDRRRIGAFLSIAQEYQSYVDRYQGVWNAEMITASPIDPHFGNKLKEKAELYFKKKIHLNMSVNPKLIGGAVLYIGNRMVDWSIKGRLKKLKEKLLDDIQT